MKLESCRPNAWSLRVWPWESFVLAVLLTSLVGGLPPSAGAVLRQRSHRPSGESKQQHSSLEGTLQEFRDALAAADDASALAAIGAIRSITAQLRNPSKRASEKADLVTADQTEGEHTQFRSEGQGSENVSLNTSNVSVNMSEVGNALPGTCLFDDQLFGLTTASKAELSTQLASPAMAQAVQWVRGGGWWSCAAEGRTCTCTGTVRMMSVDRTPLGGTVDAVPLGGQVTCSGQAFGAVRPAEAPEPPVLGASCECLTQPAAGNEFHLQKRFSSTSLLQESYIFLLRLLGRTSLLPLGTGDRVYSGIENYAGRVQTGGGIAHGSAYPWAVPQRFWITKFIREFAAPMVKAQSRCLEWGSGADPSVAFTYTKLVPGCNHEYNLQFDSTYYQGTPMHMEGNVVYSDILSLPHVLGANKMDVVFATQVFEHLADPMQAAAALFGAIAPGGLVVFSAPQQAQFHKIPHDYYRYTIEGAKYVFVNAGFCVPNWGFAGGGDFIYDVGRDSGMLVQDFTMEELEGAFQRGYDQVSHSAINIHMLAFRPPSKQCDDPSSGWAELSRQGIRA